MPFMLFEHALSCAPRTRPVNGPSVFQQNRDLVEATNESLGDIGRTILESLSQSLHLDPTKNLAAHHRKGQISPTALGFTQISSL